MAILVNGVGALVGHAMEAMKRRLDLVERSSGSLGYHRAMMIEAAAFAIHTLAERILMREQRGFTTFEEDSQYILARDRWLEAADLVIKRLEDMANVG